MPRGTFAERSACLVLPGGVQGPVVHTDQFQSMVTGWAVLAASCLSLVHDKIRADIETTHLEAFRAVRHCCYTHICSQWPLFTVYSLIIAELQWQI